jgi:GntR family transcriptional repressor for pyruvate dehydrogenase complex
MAGESFGGRRIAMQPSVAGAPRAPWEQLPDRTNLAQSLAQQILDWIRAGGVGPGDQLPSEAELKERFGVGRSTVREALNGLVLLGVIEVRHGQGAFVRPSAPTMALALEQTMRRSISEQLMESRDAIEVAIARFAAERGTAEDFARLKRLLAEAEISVSKTGAAPEASWQFHQGVAEASGNAIFVAHENMISGLLSERYGDLEQQPGYAKWEVRAHRAVYSALASRDPDRAELAIKQHHEDMRVILMSGWDAFQDSGSGEHDLP